MLLRDDIFKNLDPERLCRQCIVYILKLHYIWVDFNVIKYQLIGQEREYFAATFAGFKGEKN